MVIGRLGQSWAGVGVVDKMNESEATARIARDMFGLRLDGAF